MTTKQIQAIGNFLTYYRNDLNYIKKFQDFKNGKITPEDYIKKEVGSFYSFLIEFRVVRNFPSGTVDKLLSETFTWIYSENPDDVELLAENLARTGLTRGNVMASMASKILFLNNPWHIIPMDSLARKTLNQKQNKYSIYNHNLIKYRKENESIFESSINYTTPLIKIIHSEFDDLENLD